MSLIILEDEHGNRRTVQSGKKISPPRRPGEKIIGIDKEAKKLKRNEQYSKFVLLGNLFGMGVAEFITFAAKAFGIKPCAFCEMRRLILHRMGEIGIKKALWMLLHTFKEQSGKDINFNLAKKILVLASEMFKGKDDGVSSN